jgi:hypothetical protein
MLTSWTSHVNVHRMPSHITKKAGARKPGEPADRHSIHIKLNDQEFEQLERDLSDASKGPGGAVRHGAYAKNAIAQHAKLFAVKQRIDDAAHHVETYTRAELADIITALAG